jgi:ABC-type sugar transport system ATPase subunit
MKSQHNKPFFEVKDFTKKGIFDKISFSASRDEIVGIYGLVGSGRSELALSVFGYIPCDSGKVFMDGKEVVINSPREAINHGILYLSEDRKNLSIIGNMTLKDNVTISNLRNFSKSVFADKKAEIDTVKSLMKKLDIRASSYYQMILNLSGGNQQKAIIARLLTLDSNVIMFDEPTRGVDVGAKAEIHQVIMRLADEGNCVIVISSELPEIIGISDRVIVFREGLISGEFLMKENINQELLLKAASPAKSGEISETEIIER